MTQTQFIQALQRACPAGYTFTNPGRGQTKMVHIDAQRIVYRRGRSEIRVRVRDLYRAYRHFRGLRVSSSDLRRFAPSVFDSAPASGPRGHSCNCTVLLHLLGTLGLAGPMEGAGVAGEPYSVVVHAQ